MNSNIREVSAKYIEELSSTWSELQTADLQWSFGNAVTHEIGTLPINISQYHTWTLFLQPNLKAIGMPKSLSED